ncbi:MAG: preprotein translocase subunit SecE [Firmicutes bacterium]|nr:preprotein translocase subunit SecE [Bacillota bacterium]MBR6236474.1 preprotein translocase subunit SecE [Bacillota bacterium]
MAETVAKKKGIFGRAKDYFKGVFSEMKKVSWPSKKDTYKYTLVVIIVCAAFAVLFWLLDEVFLFLLGLIVK